MQTISKHGLDCMELEEGFRNKPYLCTAGRATVGFGSTIHIDGTPVKLTDPPVTVQEAEAMMLYHLEKRVYPVIKKYINIELAQCQFDALCSFIYNLGPQAMINGNGTRTGISMRVNVNPNDPLIIDQFLKWDRKTPAVLARHAREANLYFNMDKTDLIISKLTDIVKDKGYTVQHNLYLHQE